MKTPSRVAVLMGGKSREAEISRFSASQVEEALLKSDYTTSLIEIDDKLTKTLELFNPDVVFPALHGPPGEDGTIQGFLEILGLPYVGSGVRGSALAMDKAISKQIFRDLDIQTPPGQMIDVMPKNLKGFIKDIKESIGNKVVVKPINQGSAIGVVIIDDLETLNSTLKKSLDYGPCLIEKFIDGKEITVGILEREKALIAHPVIEITTPDDQWYDFKNRYGKNLSKHSIPARLPEHIRTQIQSLAMTAHQGLGLRDLSRADFIVSESNDIVLLEVNTLPGMTATSLYPEGAKHIGYDFWELIDLLVRQAFLRKQEQ